MTIINKRARNGSVILTDRHCEKRVTRRIKIYDRKCPGLFVSIIPAGVATFYLKFTDKTTHRQCCKWLGIYNPDFTVLNARTVVYALKTGLATARTSPRRCASTRCSGRDRARPSTRSSPSASIG